MRTAVRKCCRWFLVGSGSGARSAWFVVVALALALCAPRAGAADSGKSFSGFHAGLEAGMQNMIGGSLVGGVDVLEQESRAVGSLFAGYRWGFGGGFVAGVEAGFGLTDGRLRLEDPSEPLRVDYDNRTQWHYGITAGHTVGSAGRTLLFGYLLETTRTFDVTIENTFGTFEQNDEQGLLRYGVGVEQALGRTLGLRVTLGSSRADFGDRTTNIDVETKLDGALALTWRP